MASHVTARLPAQGSLRSLGQLIDSPVRERAMLTELACEDAIADPQQPPRVDSPFSVESGLTFIPCPCTATIEQVTERLRRASP